MKENYLINEINTFNNN